MEITFGPKLEAAILAEFGDAASYKQFVRAATRDYLRGVRTNRLREQYEAQMLADIAALEEGE